MNRTYRTSIALMAAASLLYGVRDLRAEHEKEMVNRGSGQSANEIIGKKVTNAQDEDLGKIQDIIVNIEAGTAPYAVIAHGGILGGNRSKTAVPLSSLQCSADGKKLLISATKDQLKAASWTASGAWAPVTNSDWARRVDGFYGQPESNDRPMRDRYARDHYSETNDARVYVRSPAPKGAELLMTPQDSALCERICENVDVVHVRVENGVTQIYGQVDNDEARRNLEAKVRAVPGVNKVESHIKVKQP